MLPEAFTADVRRLLEPNFTDQDATVFALRKLPKVVKTARFARYWRLQPGRTPAADWCASARSTIRPTCGGRGHGSRTSLAPVPCCFRAEALPQHGGGDRGARRGSPGCGRTG